MKVFRIISEFRILSQPQNTKSHYNSFSDTFKVYIKTIKLLNLKY